MADIFTKGKRSQIMSSISAKETRPEIAVRSFLFRRGFRFRKNVKTLPGKPDIVLHKFKTVVFIHGCFWHGHQKCKRASLPKTNKAFWSKKIKGNTKRDERNYSDSKKIGWRLITIWQCQLRNHKMFESTMESLTRSLLSGNLNLYPYDSTTFAKRRPNPRTVQRSR
jgi:DNA mismatch endonuclease (patch repair protein)